MLLPWMQAAVLSISATNSASTLQTDKRHGSQEAPRGGRCRREGRALGTPHPGPWREPWGVQSNVMKVPKPELTG